MFVALVVVVVVAAVVVVVIVTKVAVVVVVAVGFSVLVRATARLMLDAWTPKKAVDNSHGLCRELRRYGGLPWLASPEPAWVMQSCISFPPTGVEKIWMEFLRAACG